MKPWIKRALIASVSAAFFSSAAAAADADISARGEPRCAAEAINEQIALAKRTEDSQDVDWGVPAPATKTSCSTEILGALGKIQIPTAVASSFLSGLLDINKLISGFQDQLCKKAEGYIDDAWEEAQQRAKKLGSLKAKLPINLPNYPSTIDLGSVVTTGGTLDQTFNTPTTPSTTTPYYPDSKPSPTTPRKPSDGSVPL